MPDRDIQQNEMEHDKGMKRFDREWHRPGSNAMTVAVYAMDRALQLKRLYDFWRSDMPNGGKPNSENVEVINRSEEGREIMGDILKVGASIRAECKLALEAAKIAHTLEMDRRRTLIQEAEAAKEAEVHESSSFAGNAQSVAGIKRSYTVARKERDEFRKKASEVLEAMPE